MSFTALYKTHWKFMFRQTSVETVMVNVTALTSSIASTTHIHTSF